MPASKKLAFNPPKDYPWGIVVWDDAHGTATKIVRSETLDQEHEPAVVFTSGWIMRQDKDGVSICGEYCGDGDYRGHTFIPAAMVKKVIVVRKGATNQETAQKGETAAPPESPGSEPA